MGKIKIGIFILTLATLVSLLLSSVTLAQPLFEQKSFQNIEYVSDEIIVKFKGDIKPFRVVKVPHNKVLDKVREYRQRADVVYTEPNYIAYALMVPNDPYYSYQWHLPGINIEAAWDIQTGDAGVVVGILDTGVAYENYTQSWWRRYYLAPDLAQTSFVAGYDFINNDSHANDDNGHGTHVCGTAAQSTNNNLGVAGVAFKTSIMPVKVLNSNGSGTYAQIADGIYFAADNGAQVINLSLGGGANSNILKEAVAYAYNKGVTIVAAAGNNGSNSILYPAAYDDYVLAVGATRYDKTLAYYSSYGSSLDLVAPGGDLNVDQNNDGYGDGVLQQTFGQRTNDFGYYFYQGTSMATPHVAGVAALVLANGNADTPDQVRAALEETAQDLGPTGRDNTYGWGLVDAAAALNWTAEPEEPECLINADCDDGLFCNGTETCLAGLCQVGTPIDCDDHKFCTTDTCDEATKSCLNTPVANGTSCDDGLYCNGAETCQAGLCQAGTPVSCDDGVACTEDSCDEANNQCLNNPDHSYCDNGLYCDGAETCHLSLGCQAGSPVSCDDEVTCTIDSCDEDLDTCANTWPACGINDSCCGPDCDSISDPDCSSAVLCWSGDNQYLYRSRSQAQKFCKCASGLYGYQNYSYGWLKAIVYQYLNTQDNENWDVSSRSSYLPINSVTCPDGLSYPTNQGYYYK